MLVGWSYGTVVGLKALQIVANEGVRVETFVDLDCFNLNWHMGRCIHPSNANRLVVIHSRMNRMPKGYRCPVVHQLDSCWHLGSPTDPKTTRLLQAEARWLYASAPHEIPAISMSAPSESEQFADSPPALPIPH